MARTIAEDETESLLGRTHGSSAITSSRAAEIDWLGGVDTSAVLRALLLLVIGTVLLAIDALMLMGAIESTRATQMYLLLAALLTFPPGLYATRLAVLSYRRRPGGRLNAASVLSL